MQLKYYKRYCSDIENIENFEKAKGKHIGNTNTKGMHWYNNGIENKLCFECPTGFVPGMLR